MFTKWNNTNWSVTGEKRLLFMAPRPEGPKALDEAQLAASTIAERAEALTLDDDTENPQEANADHSAVKEYVATVEAALKKTISGAGIKEKTVAAKDKTDLDGKKTALTNLKSQVSANALENAAALAGRFTEYPAIQAAINAEGATVDSVKAAITAEEAQLAAELTKAEAELTAAEGSENAAKAVTEQLQTLAIDTIREKQERRFKEAKIDFSANKIAALFIDTKDLNHDQKCLLAGQFLSGLLSNAELKLKPDDATAEFESCMKRTSDDAIKQYVDKLISGEKDTLVNAEMEKVFGTEYAKVPADARAYVHGLIASTRGETVSAPGTDWINSQLTGMSPLTVENVERALSGYHLKNPNSQKMENSAGYKTLTENSPEKNNIDEMLKDPGIRGIYNRRMVQAEKVLGSDESKLANYQKYFIAQMLKCGNDSTKVIQIPTPDFWANRADTLNSLPKGSKPATHLTPDVVNVATRMAKRCTDSGAKEGQVYAFTHGEKIYYAVYRGGGNVTIHDVPGGADMSSEMPAQQALAVTSSATPATSSKLTGAPKKQPVNERAAGISVIQQSINASGATNENDVKVALRLAINNLSSAQLDAMKDDTYLFSAGDNTALKYTIYIDADGNPTYGTREVQPAAARTETATATSPSVTTTGVSTAKRVPKQNTA